MYSKAINEAESDDKSKRKTKSSKKATLTLEVSPESSEKLMLAQRMGNIGIALRSIGDTHDSLEGDETTTDVGMSKVMTKLSSFKKQSSSVRVYNGTAVNEVTPRRGNEQNAVSFDVEDGPSVQQKIYVTPEALLGLDEQE